MGEVVDRGRTSERRIVFEDQLYVLRCALISAHLRDIHLREPAVIFCLALFGREVLPHLRKALLTNRNPYAVISRRELLHRLVARQTPRWRVRCGVLVANAKLVNAYKVECVDELPAARVRAVMAKEELTVIVDHSTCGRRPRRIGVAVIRRALRIDPGEERIHRLGHRIRTAERADDAPLGQRILLFLGGPANLGVHA